MATDSHKGTNRAKQRGNVEILAVGFLLAAMLVFLGFLLAETQTVTACKDFDRFSSLGNIYECKKLEKKHGN